MNSSLRVWLSGARVDLGKVRAFISTRYSIGDDAAGDIVQTACLKMLSSRRKIRNPFAFLVQTSKNLALNKIARDKVSLRHREAYLRHLEMHTREDVEPKINPADYDDSPAYPYIAGILEGYSVKDLAFLFGESHQEIYRVVRSACVN